jgi:hypothetical protein
MSTVSKMLYFLIRVYYVRKTGVHPRIKSEGMLLQNRRGL